MLGGRLGGRLPPRTVIDETRTLRLAIGAARDLSVPDSENERKRATEDIASSLRTLKYVLFPDTSGESLPGEDNVDGNAENVNDVNSLTEIARSTDFLLVLADGVGIMDFETRKDAVQVFNNLLRRTLSSENSASELVARDGTALIALLVKGYDDADVALNCGSMLRECIRAEDFAKVAVNHTSFWRFFDLVEVSDFDVASDAFAAFKEMLTRHVHVGAQLIEENYDRFTTSYNKLLRSSNYVTRRQSLKLLGQMLVERKFFKMMTRYISSATNLRLVMNLLLDQRKNIQFEAFHVFKIFVANPNKNPEVRQILVRNKERLLVYLADFQADRQDGSFQEDRALILDEIRKVC